MTAITALLLFTVWTVLLVLGYVTYRVLLVFTGKKKANSWTRGTVTDDPALFTRMQHAHLNSLETLPVFAAVVLAAHALGQLPVVDQIGLWVLLLRIAQSVTHLIGVTHWLVFIRANFYTLQMLLLLYAIFRLLA